MNHLDLTADHACGPTYPIFDRLVVPICELNDSDVQGLPSCLHAPLLDQRLAAQAVPAAIVVDERLMGLPLLVADRLGPLLKGVHKYDG